MSIAEDILMRTALKTIKAKYVKIKNFITSFLND